MTNPNNIPQGYKMTPLGIIPEEWKVKRLGDVAQSFSGGTPKAGNAKYYDGNIPFIRSGEIHQKDTTLFLSELGLISSSAKMVQKGDLLMALYGANSGDTAVSQINGAINQAILCIRPHNLLVSFLCSFLRLKKDMYIAKYLQGGQGNLSGEIVNNYMIPIPPIEEQHKITEVLDTWDKAIEKQTQLIEKLELRKKGLMQQLLTGKRRIPGFSTPWRDCVMQQLFTPITVVNDGKPHLPMTISAKLGLISQQNKFDRVIAGDSLKKYTLIQYGDFAYNKGNSNLYEMGCIYQLKEESALVPFVYICFRAKESVCGDFYQQYFLNHGLDRQLKRIITSGARGDGLLNVDKKDFFSLKVINPSFEEQIAIAQVLTTTDHEIELALQKLELLRQQKCGLMQQLLTGKKE